MLDGIGFQELLLIGFLVLLLFGSKGMAGVMRDLGRWAGKLKHYRDTFSREMTAIQDTLQDSSPPSENTTQRLRQSARKAVAAMSAEARKEGSRRIADILFRLPEYQTADALFCFVSTPEEVNTFPILEQALSDDKALFIPYCLPDNRLGMARIRDIARDLQQGAYHLFEPRQALRNEPISPLSVGLFLIPGTAFDKKGSRLGKGKGYFDRFLSGIKGNRPILALAFDEQIVSETISRQTHDISPDRILTPTLTLPEVHLG